MVRQLKRTRLDRYFHEVLCAGFLGGVEGKRRILEDYPVAFLVGDTEVDLEAGRSISATVISVSWGLRNASFLKHYSPSYIVNKPPQLIEVTGNRS
jgi:phosphoglycolate phosphatase-like HAD superfamily hydrolase